MCAELFMLDYRSSLMGNRPIWTKMNAVQMITKGYVATSKVLTVSSSTPAGDYWISSLDAAETSGLGGYSVIWIVDVTTAPAKSYYFSYRTNVGYSSLENKYLNGVNVHYYRATTMQYSYYVKTLSNAAAFTTPAKAYTFTQVSTNSTHALVRITCPTCGTPNPTPNPPPTSVTFSWLLGSWSSCSASCGSGVQTRTVTCKGSDNSIAPDSSCTSAIKPPTTQSCSSGSCASYNWLAGSWVRTLPYL